MVQRVPVRIYFDKNDKLFRKLKAGMSVYATIDTNHRRALPACSACRRRWRTRATIGAMTTPGASSAAVPGLRRNMVTICAMTATIMQALDTTIANRAALHAGHAVGLAGPDQLGADLLHRRRRDHDRAGGLDRQPLRPQAHLHHLLGRLHHRFRDVRAGWDITQMVLFRLLQGVFGAALVPLSQAVMLGPTRCMSAPRRWRSGAWA